MEEAFGGSELSRWFIGVIVNLEFGLIPFRCRRLEGEMARRGRGQGGVNNTTQIKSELMGLGRPCHMNDD
jgi:hypothetical protein